MTIEQPAKHPQTQAFHEAYATMRRARYIRTEILEERIEILQALSDVVAEVAYHLDQHQILDPGGMEAYRQASYMQLSPLIPTGAQIVLVAPTAAAIENLKVLLEL